VNPESQKVFDYINKIRNEPQTLNIEYKLPPATFLEFENRIKREFDKLNHKKNKTVFTYSIKDNK
jgi:hypothetical protein